MLELINEFEKNTPNNAVIKFALRNSTPGSKLRKLMVEEVAYQIKDPGLEGNEEVRSSGVMADGLAAIVDGQGILPELFQAYARVQEDPGVFSHRTESVKDGKGRADWRDYMVGEGPEKHWIHER